MSEEQSFPCDELGCDRSFKNRTALLKHKRDTHIAKTRKSKRVREGGRVYNPSATSQSKFTVAQASRNSAYRRKRSAQQRCALASPNTEETDKKKLKNHVLVQIPNDRLILLQLLRDLQTCYMILLVPFLSLLAYFMGLI